MKHTLQLFFCFHRILTYLLYYISHKTFTFSFLTWPLHSPSLHDLYNLLPYTTFTFSFLTRPLRSPSLHDLYVLLPYMTFTFSFLTWPLRSPSLHDLYVLIPYVNVALYIFFYFTQNLYVISTMCLCFKWPDYKHDIIFLHTLFMT
jgi:hypothetical protein